MAVIKCKMCGGELQIVNNETIGVCEFCGTKQTVPSVKDENLQGLFNRANALRQKGDFDKAELLYEKIISSDSTQAEAYWGLILCKYGIEYVEDPVTFKRVPTCHRASFDSVAADSDYESALKYAEPDSRSIYEAEAKEIDSIQKEILAISQKEEPYDVFICYKETDESGKRTPDSVIANDIYHQLTQEGFKVFYAAITLEDKLGKEYEPYIFAALNSAKVMLAIGTKADYFNAVWVKNEWSRYLKLIKKDHQKLLIPCYRDMDAYDLPDEFSHLQAQDMSKIGFINDIVRGIKKVVVKDEPAPAVAEKESSPLQNASANIEPLLKRMFLFLEDKNFRSADEYAEKALDIDPENPQAYLGKLLVEFKLPDLKSLVSYPDSFTNNLNYQKIRRFGDEKLLGQIDAILNEREEISNSKIYSALTNKMKNASDPYDYIDLSLDFHNISSYKDAENLGTYCLQKAKDIAYDTATKFMSEDTIDSCNKAIKYFEIFPDYKDSSELTEKCKTRIEDLQEELTTDSLYKRAMSLYESNTIISYQKALEIFNDISHWKLSREFAEKCTKRIEELKNEQAIQEAKQKKQTTIKRIIAVSLAVIILVLISNVPKIVKKRTDEKVQRDKYSLAMRYYEEGSYEVAEKRFKDLGDYKDSIQKAEESRYLLNCEKYEKAIKDANSGNKYSISNAKDAFSQLGDFKDSKVYLSKFEEKLSTAKHNCIDSGYYDAEDEYEYDAQGNLASFKRTMINNGTKEYYILDTYTHKKSEIGRIEEVKITYDEISSNIIFEHSDDTPVGIKYYYDANDRLIQETTDYYDGSSAVVFYRWYDENDKLLTTDVTDEYIRKNTPSNGTAICLSKVVNEFEDTLKSWEQSIDKKGKLSDIKSGLITSELTYKNGNLVKIQYSNNTSVEITYDNYGNKTSRKSYEEGKLASTIDYSYQPVFIPDKE